MPGGYEAVGPIGLGLNDGLALGVGFPDGGIPGLCVDMNPPGRIGAFIVGRISPPGGRLISPPVGLNSPIGLTPGGFGPAGLA